MRFLVPLALAVVLSGCATVVSDGHPGKVDTQQVLKDDAFGIVYSLPMRLAKLTASRKQVPSDLGVQVKAAESAVSGAGKALADAETELNRKQKAHDSNPTEGTKDELERAKESRKNAKENKRKAEAKLQDLQQLANAAGSGDAKRVYTVKVELLKDQGDPHQVYVANLDHSPSRDDKVTLATTAEGLLTSTNVTAADKTSDILISIASALAAFGVISPTAIRPAAVTKLPTFFLEAVKLPPGKRIPAKLPGCSDDGKDITLQFVFDPSDRSDVDRVNRKMLECLVPYKIEVRRFDFATDNKGSEYSFEENYLKAAGVKASAGLVYRRPLPYLIEISRWHFLDEERAKFFISAACQSAGLRRFEEHTHRDSLPEPSTKGTDANTVDCSYVVPDELYCLPRPAANIPNFVDSPEPFAKKFAKEKECKGLDSDPGRAANADEEIKRQKAWNQNLASAIRKIFAPIKDEYTSEQATMAKLPNKGPLGLVPFDSSMFVTTDYKVEFENGYPIKWAADRPSELAAFFRIPVEIAKAVLQIPAELIKLRFDLTSESSNLTKATIQQLCLSIQLAAIRNASDDDPSNDEEITVPELCQSAGGA